ncbi:MAG: HAMP domain-containing histidine kinase [Oscillospiraceae bacterium]|nr:HAMP domain-containing histidine kinase [Oscillospiraceae bacterium]
MKTLQGALVLIGVTLILFALNFFILNILPSRRRKYSVGERQQSIAKKMVRLIALLLAEAFALALVYGSMAYVFSLNGTLALEGDTETMMKKAGSREVHMFIDLPCLFTPFPGYRTGTSGGAIPGWRQSALYDKNWELVDYSQRLPKGTRPDSLEEMLEKVKGAGEASIDKTTLRMPKIIYNIFSFLSYFPVAYEPYYEIEKLPLREHIGRLIAPREHEYCVKVVLKSLPAEDENWDIIFYTPLAFGEKQIAALDTALYDETSDVYYLYARCEMSQLDAVYFTMYIYLIWPNVIISFALLLILSVLAQSVYSFTYERRRLESQRDLLVAVAHEMKTPMGATMLYADKIGRAEDLPEELITPMAALRGQVYGMRDRQNDLLTLSKLDIPAALSKTSFALDDLLEDVFDEYVPRMEEKGLAYNMDSQRGVKVYADRARIRIAVSNYLSNAVKFTPEGGEIKLKMEITRGKRVRVSVYNRGPRIAKEDMEKIWEYLYKTGKSNNADSGTGLGLPITRRIAALHGGGCGAENTGDGVLFWMEIPVGKEKKTKA